MIWIPNTAIKPWSVFWDRAYPMWEQAKRRTTPEAFAKQIKLWGGLILEDMEKTGTSLDEAFRRVYASIERRHSREDMGWVVVAYVEMANRLNKRDEEGDTSAEIPTEAE